MYFITGHCQQISCDILIILLAEWRFSARYSAGRGGPAGSRIVLVYVHYTIKSITKACVNLDKRGYAKKFMDRFQSEILPKLFK